MWQSKMYPVSKPHFRKSKATFYHKFPRYNEILCYLQNLVLDFPDNVRLEKIGTSYLGRPINMVIVQADQAHPKQGVMIEGGIHAREWLSHTTSLYVIEYLLNKGTLLDLMDFYVIPCVNPDGYEYSHTHRRLWRKNMNRNGSSKVTQWGVDINRNFPFKYGLTGSSPLRCSYMYRGRFCLSEPESKSLAHAVTKYARCIRLYVAIHCFGNLILYPWGYTTESVQDADDLHECATEAQQAMKNQFPKSRFRVGSLARTMYISSGSTLDYVRGIHHIKFAFTMELHKGGKSGFTPSTLKIINVAQETVVGIEAMVKFVYFFYYKKKRKSSSALINSECKRMRN